MNNLNNILNNKPSILRNGLFIYFTKAMFIVLSFVFSLSTIVFITIVIIEDNPNTKVCLKNELIVAFSTIGLFFSILNVQLCKMVEKRNQFVHDIDQWYETIKNKNLKEI